MKTLVIPDIHNHFERVEVFLDKLETKLKFDEIVFLGDYFDDFGDTPGDAIKTATWLKRSLQDPRRIHLVGNHDMPYLVQRESEHTYCPGWTKIKHDRVNEIMKRSDWDKIRPAYYSQDWLFSHAGFSGDIFTKPRVEAKPEDLIAQVEKAFEQVKTGMFVPEFAAGWRMGTPWYGGITWSHWGNEFRPIPGINQMVGHTIGSFPRADHLKPNKNYCIDCAGNVAVAIQDGELSIIINDEINHNTRRNRYTREGWRQLR